MLFNIIFVTIVLLLHHEISRFSYYGITAVLLNIIFVFQFWPKLDGPIHDHFVTFPTDARLYNRPVTSVSSKNIKVSN